MVKSVRPSIAASFLVNSSAIACLAFSLAIGRTAVTSPTPLSFASLTSFCAAVAASAVSTLSGCPSTLAVSASANFLASAFAAAFSSSVRSLRASISLFLAVNAVAIASFAFSFATGLTFAISPVPAVLACSTAVSVVAASIALVASSAALLFFAIAASFSACVKLGSALIASSFVLRAASIAFLASGFLTAVGFTDLTSAAPFVPAASTAS